MQREIEKIIASQTVCLMNEFEHDKDSRRSTRHNQEVKIHAWIKQGMRSWNREHQSIERHMTYSSLGIAVNVVRKLTYALPAGMEVMRIGRAFNRISTKLCSRSCLLLPLFLVFVLIVTRARAQSESSKGKEIVIGFSQNLFTGQDQRDVAAALDVFAQELSKKAGLSFLPQMRLFDSPDTYSDAIQRGSLSIVCATTSDYFQLRKKSDLSPFVVPTVNGSSSEDRILLVHTASNLTNLTSLAKKKIVFKAGARGEISQRWLTVELFNLHQPVPEFFFSKIILAKKESEALMSVFFRQADAAIVTTTAYTIMTEQNPQLKRDLVIIARSPRYMYSVICFTNNISANDRLILSKTFLSMNSYTAGRQILQVFQHDDMAAFQMDNMNTIEQLESDYQRVLASKKLSKKL